MQDKIGDIVVQNGTMALYQGPVSNVNPKLLAQKVTEPPLRLDSIAM